LVYVIFGNGFEEMEALAPVDLLRRAGADVVTVGIGSREITGSNGTVVKTDITDDKMVKQGLEMIVLPGGLGGTAEIMKSQRVKDMVQYAHDSGAYICAICAAPTVLGSMGLLKGRKATCYPGNEEKLIGAEVVDADIVRDGKIITARAAALSIPFGLRLVEAVKGSEAASIVRNKICYTENVIEVL
jgi:4-methyl-5(b-hydroxyethyl)-thiazole monophosphate biosynthesis